MLEDLKGKKIAIVGFGTNNRKLAAFFAKHGVEFETIENWGLNSSLIGRLDSYDVIFRTPGLPYNSPAIQQAKQKGVEVSSQTKLFFKLCPAAIIGVTGTKGKGTTSTLIARILSAAGGSAPGREITYDRVWLGGNIGVDPFEFIDEIKASDLVVLELSSFQLQDLQTSPHVAVVLNITADHLDPSGSYESPSHASLEEYTNAKLQIVAHQTEKDFAVMSHELPESAHIGKGRKIIFSPADVADFEYNLIGKHNLENIAAAVAVGKIYDVPEEKMRAAVLAFKGLPHRLQITMQKDGITYVDDSVSTNEDSTIAAIRAFAGPLILIAGGSSKGLDYNKLGQVIVSSPNLKALVLVGQEADKISKAAAGFRGKIFTGAKSMEEIVRQAKSAAVSGDTILLSPAAASFDMFTDYKDRAAQFAEEISK
ncbi:MAG TPA: UDP-N-acetylmuramoyl-L-alanine--D-glutamate ligase [Patescibacteria group bacterium]|nr:UDP-N-acetylmuramoyl-L-alanine--D-glutamate ligase [Patescibacteria group bacterium]